MDRNELKLCGMKIQDGHSGSAPLNKMAARAKKYKIFKRHQKAKIVSIENPGWLQWFCSIVQDGCQS